MRPVYLPSCPNDGSSSSGSDRYQSATKAYTLTAPIASTWSLPDRILLEFKAVERLLPIYEAQVITYLRLSRLPVGLLVNFNVTALRNGLRRLTPDHPKSFRSSALPVRAQMSAGLRGESTRTSAARH